MERFPSHGIAYATPLEHLTDLLEKIRIFLAHQLEVRRAMAAGDDAPAGARAVERFVTENVEPSRVPWTPAIASALAAVDAHVASRAAATPIERRPFSQLTARLGLDGIAADLLLAALAPHTGRGFREAMQLLGPESAPGIHRAAHLVELVAGTPERCDAAIAAFDDDAPLLSSGALRADRAAPSPLWRSVGPSPLLLRWLRGGAPPAPPLADAGSWSSKAPAERQTIDAALATKLQALVEHAASQSAPLRLLLIGEAGSGKSRAAAVLAALLGRGVLELHPASLRPERTDDLTALLLDARLRGQLVYLHAREAAPSPALLHALAHLDVPCVTSTHTGEGWEALPLLGFVRLNFEPPGAQAQLAAWRSAVGDALPEQALVELVHRHALDFHGIERAAAETRAAMHHGAALPERNAVAIEAARAQVRHRLRDVADRIVTTLTWDDLVLPAEVREAVEEVWRAAAARQHVYERWGFGAKTPYGRAISALFSGDAGTGKTMVATLIARQLGMELYRVDLSRMVDKYVGETEKHLATLFAEAERGRCVILFDEADALFGKRTQKGDSGMERYANLEVNYLLQRIETFSGVAILTTNQETAIDQAFKRRIRYHVDFPFPEPSERETLWRRMLPADAPVAPDVDLQKLATKYEMSGGHIRSAVLRAAFAAAAAEGPIDRARLQRAAEQEYQNMGKLVRH